MSNMTPLFRLLSAAFKVVSGAVGGAPAWVWRAAGLMAAGVLAFALLTRAVHQHDARERDIGALAVRDSVAEVMALRWHVAKDSIGKRIDRQTVTLVRTTHRVDTLWQQVPETLATRADTVKALSALPVLHRATDSAIAACSEFQISCAEYRRVSDSLEHALRQRISILEAVRNETKPPSTFHRVLTWAEIIGAGYAGYRLGHGR